MDDEIGGLISGGGGGYSLGELDGMMSNFNSEDNERQTNFAKSMLDFVNAGQTNSEDSEGQSGMELNDASLDGSSWGGQSDGLNGTSSQGAFGQQKPFWGQSAWQGAGLETPYPGTGWSSADPLLDLTRRIGNFLQAGSNTGLANPSTGGSAAGATSQGFDQGSGMAGLLTGGVGSAGGSGGNWYNGSYRYDESQGLAKPATGYGLWDDSTKGFQDGLAPAGSGGQLSDYSDGLWGGYGQMDLDGGQDYAVPASSTGSAPQADPAAKESPSPRGTILITTYDYGVGSHSALYIPGKGVLYDPAGTYGGRERPTNGTFYDATDADLAAFIKYHQDSGSSVALTTIPPLLLRRIRSLPEWNNFVINLWGNAPMRCLPLSGVFVEFPDQDCQGYSMTKQKEPRVASRILMERFVISVATTMVVATAVLASPVARFFFFMIKRAGDQFYFSVVFFSYLCCFLLVFGSLMRRQRILFMILFAALSGVLVSNLTMVTLRVVGCWGRWDRCLGFFSTGVWDTISFLLFVAFIECSYLISICAALILRFTWKYYDKWQTSTITLK